MKVKINRFMNTWQASHGIVIEVPCFMTLAEIMAQEQTREAFGSLIQRKIEEVARALTDDGAALYRGWKK